MSECFGIMSILPSASIVSWVAQICFFAYYELGPPQVSISSLLYALTPLRQFLCLMWGPPRSVFSHTIGGPLRLVSLFTTCIWEPPSCQSYHVSYFAYYMYAPSPSCRSVSSLTIAAPTSRQFLGKQLYRDYKISFRFRFVWIRSADIVTTCHHARTN